ncbi:MAG: phage virion morphogenesis protein [Deltaproteobacteria bacterium]|nr:phage virion morphogenesis protein [Deltaproteobacteria bacterium]
MAGALVEIKIDDSEMQELFGRVMAHMTDMTPVMREIGEIVDESVQRNFEEHRAPDGTPWKPLAESTKRQKAKRGRNPDDILIMNRILMGSIHPDAYPDRMEIGTDEVYAAVHQFGIGERSVIASGRRMAAIPARPFLGVRDEDWPEIKNAILHFLVSSKQ